MIVFNVKINCASFEMLSGVCVQKKDYTRPGVDKVKPKVWFKYSQKINY